MKICLFQHPARIPNESAYAQQIVAADAWSHVWKAAAYEWHMLGTYGGAAEISVGRIVGFSVSPNGVHTADVKLQEENVASKKTFIESRFEMEKILAEEHVGYLGLSKDGMPYVIPVTFGFVNDTILFHCSLEGKKLDYMRANPQVCFTVARQFGEMVPHPQGASCHADSDSVVSYGIARIAANAEERRRILTLFNRCLQPKSREITPDEVATCNAVEIKITEMTGRLERDSNCTYWRQGISPD